MKGHIRQRGMKSWAIIIDLGKDEQGKRRQKWHSFKGSKREAQKETARIISRLTTNTYVEPSKDTVGAYLDRWLEHLRAQGLARRTLTDHELICRRHLIPALGEIPLQKLDGEAIDTYYGRAQAGGGLHANRPLSARYVLGHHRVLHKALDKAVAWKKIPRNPCDDASPPRPKASPARALDEERIKALLAAAEGTRLHAAVALALSTGMRKGEVLALQWRDVEGDWLTISHTLEQTAGHVALKTPKSYASRRRIKLPANAVEILRLHRVNQKKERLMLGAEYDESGLVFSKVDGTIWPPTSFDWHFGELVKTADVGHVRFHDLRHSHATQLLRRGINVKVVSERLGHASIRITLETYAHVMPDMQEEAASAINDLIGGAS